MEKIKVKETSTAKEYELDKADLVPASGDEEVTWYNKTAGIMDKFRLIPRLIMLAYIYAFYSATTWFMALPDPTNAWFKKTAMGKWFYGKMESWYNWAAERYDLKILTAEEKTMQKFPALKNKLDAMESRIKKLEKKK